MVKNTGGWLDSGVWDFCLGKDISYQAFYGLEHYNLSETGSFLIRKPNQPTRCLMSQSKGKNTLKPPFYSTVKYKIMCLVNKYE